jgi:hypothetical protein
MPDRVTAAESPSQQPLLLDVLRERAQRFGHCRHIVASYVEWVTNLVCYYGRQHPRELHAADIGRFLEHVVRNSREPLIAMEEARTAVRAPL